MWISFTTWTPGMTRWRDSSSWVFLDFGTTTLSVACEFHTLKIMYDSVRENWALAFEYKNVVSGFWYQNNVCGMWISQS
jgi:hypothetical protein